MTVEYSCNHEGHKRKRWLKANEGVQLNYSTVRFPMIMFFFFFFILFYFAIKPEE